jgi:osmotically-inducible protein OsmY
MPERMTITGPDGYRRGDDQLREMLRERLRDDPNIDASGVSVSVTGGRVTLEGTVGSHATSILIEDVAEQFGVDDVTNNLRVRRPGMARSSAMASQDVEM